jgi:acyl dehydratase
MQLCIARLCTGEELISTEVKLDLTDVEHRIGQLVGGGQQYHACSHTDIRRWVMALDYPNPIHWDEEFARSSAFGDIVAPQSMAACLDVGHGTQPACVGRIPGSHVIFGGEEWWFYGHHIRPGDRLIQERRFLDYKVTETRFAGPTVFQRGETVHRNQNGTLVAKERATAIRYLVTEANKRKASNERLGEIKRWTSGELEEVSNIRHAWILSNRLGVSPRFSEVKIGDKLPRRVLGPHTLISFATEYRAFIGSIWGTYEWVAPQGVQDPWINQDAGWVDGFGLDHQAAKIDPRYRDGLVSGPSRGHVNNSKAGEIGMARAYGYGATMGAWNTDFLAYWAGNDGVVRYTKTNFRSPAFEGDLTFFDGEVVDKEAHSEWGVPLVTVNVKLTSQDGKLIVDSTNKVELPP